MGILCGHHASVPTGPPGSASASTLDSVPRRGPLCAWPVTPIPARPPRGHRRRARRAAVRARLPVRARVPGAGGLPAPAPAGLDAGRRSASPSRRSRSRSADGLRLPGWYMPAGPDAAAGRRPGPRLGVGARPDAPPRAGPARGRVPRPDLRRPRATARTGRRCCRCRSASTPPTRARRSPELRRRPEVTTIGVLGHSMGGAGALVAAAEDADVDGGDRGRRRPPTRTGSPARRSASPGCPIPGADRLAARLADDARLPPAARPHGRAR